MRERETDDVEKSWKHETGFHRDRSQMRACVVLLLAIAPCVRGRSDAPLLQRSVAQAPRLNFLRASATGQAKGTVRRSESSLDSPERPLQATAFLFVMGLSLVTLTPTSHFIKALGPERGMKWLTMISTMSAATEIGLSPLVGGLSDAFGRKSVLAITLGLSLLVNCAAAAFPTLLPLGISKFVSSFVVGIFFLAAGASIADVYRQDPKRLASVSGILFALVNAGFASGIAVSALLPRSLRVRYMASATMMGSALVCLLIGARETLPPAARLAFRATSFNPFAFVQLLTAGRTMRLLACLAALNVAPMFMGDTLQVFSMSVWGLSEAHVSKLFTFVAVSGVLANTLSGQLIKWCGLQAFTALATGSALLMWLGFASASLRAALVCAALGLLGPARTLGATTMIASEGARLGVPQGDLAGRRANLIAWLKVVGPLLYGQLYLRGAAVGAPQAPFYFNAILTIAALALGPFALQAAADAEAHANGDAPRARARASKAA